MLFIIFYYQLFLIFFFLFVYVFIHLHLSNTKYAHKNTFDVTLHQHLFAAACVPECIAVIFFFLKNTFLFSLKHTFFYCYLFCNQIWNIAWILYYESKISCMRIVPTVMCTQQVQTLPMYRIPEWIRKEQV